MVNWVLQKIIGTHHERTRKRLWPIVEQITRLEPQMQQRSDAQLRAKTDELRARFTQEMGTHRLLTPASPEWYEHNRDEPIELRRKQRAIQQRPLDLILPEAFALVRGAARRTVNMRHFDVQLLGGMILHEGKIAEMATREGKTPG